MTDVSSEKIMAALTDTKTEKVAQLIENLHGKSISHLLVVGCGTGLEAAILAQRVGARVTGIDLEDRFDERANLRMSLVHTRVIHRKNFVGCCRRCFQLLTSGRRSIFQPFILTEAV